MECHDIVRRAEQYHHLSTCMCMSTATMRPIVTCTSKKVAELGVQYASFVRRAVSAGNLDAPSQEMRRASSRVRALGPTQDGGDP